MNARRRQAASRPTIAARPDIIYDIRVVRLVLDTNVMVAAITSPRGASRLLLSRVLKGDAELAVSTPLFVEYEAVLLRPERLAAANATPADIGDILDAIAAIAIPVAFDFRWRPSGADADDELVVETAANGRADAIATFNLRDLRAAAASLGIIAERPGPILRRFLP